MGRLVLSTKGFTWFQKGHPWIFRSDLEKIEGAAPGSIVTLEKRNGQFLARGFYSDRSKIAFRLITRSQATIDPSFWHKRVEDALGYRRAVVGETDAYRLIYGESDGIPSLIVDRYADHLVMQTLSQGAENLLPLLTEILARLFRPSSIVLRNDLAVRELEGLPQEKKVLAGDLPPRVRVTEGDIQYWADLWNGQKTGAYLDQRENRQRAARFLRGKVLDAFCYQGLFALHAARQASRVVAVDSSREALDRAQGNAELNGFPHIEFRKANVFDFLKGEAEHGEAYDGIILDPPAFAKRKENIPGATKGYKELNLRALRLLKPGGVLVTASCSYNLSEAQFLEIIKGCMKDCGESIKIIEKRSQSADHPILLSFPESHYLKCFFLVKNRCF